ncbi:MAG: AAA family ATPase [Halobacteriota archaeon]
MYLKNLKIENIGPIKRLDYELPFFDNGNPKPVIFVGKNGCGKSTLLSYIVNCFFEFKREHYDDIEIKKDKLFKLQSLSYVTTRKGFGWVSLEYHKTDSLFYTEVLSKIPHDEFIKIYQDGEIPNFNKDDERFKEYRLFQNYSRGKTTKKAIDECVILYFPDNRFEFPAWLNEEAFTKTEFESKRKLITESRRKIIITDTLKNLEGWILDVVLDTGVSKNSFDVSLRLEINRIIKAILINKYPEKQGIRFGVNTRKLGVRVAIVNNILDNEGNRVRVEEITPTLYHLSSGESSLLVLFASILRDYDNVVVKSEFILEDIEGIVLIDEIDAHLHIDLQSSILPELIKLFPKIQFIMTTHSPFFLSGMQEVFGDDIDIIDLPEGDSIKAVSFSEFVKALDIFNEEGAKFKEELDKLKTKLNEITAPLIVTEGKSDWKHFKKATEKLNIEENLSFYEFEKDMGDGQLLKLCESYSKLKNDKLLIFIFDRDNPEILKKVAGENEPFKNWGNNVFSFAIPVPTHREGYENVSIEFYYTDSEIKTKGSNERRLFFSSEFKKRSGRHKSDENLTFCNANKLKYITDEKKAKIIDSEVLNENEENVALSKADFAEYVFKNVPPFNNFKFDEFRKIFDITQSILASANKE